MDGLECDPQVTVFQMLVDRLSAVERLQAVTLLQQLRSQYQEVGTVGWLSVPLLHPRHRLPQPARPKRLLRQLSTCLIHIFLPLCKLRSLNLRRCAYLKPSWAARPLPGSWSA
jgi:hypothetical protein